MRLWTPDAGECHEPAKPLPLVTARKDDLQTLSRDHSLSSTPPETLTS